MQITTTAIKHKRYSTYGWNDLKDGKYINTLTQGEIGLLLGHKDSSGNIIIIDESNFSQGLILNSILEVRIGTDANQYFFDALPIKTDYTIRTVSVLPAFGKPDCLYIRTSDNSAHYWNDEKNMMVQLAGGSGSDIQADLANYVLRSDFEVYKLTVNTRLSQVETALTTVQEEVAKKASTIRVDLLDSQVIAVQKSLSDIDQKLSSLEGGTYFVGFGPIANRPATAARPGAIYVATDNNKEYIWSDSAEWIELGDVTAEAKKIEELETRFAQFDVKLADRATIAYVAETIAQAKIDAVNEAIIQAIAKINEAEAKISQEIARTKVTLENKIAENTAKFNSYYTKEETQEVVDNTIMGLTDLDGNAPFYSA